MTLLVPRRTATPARRVPRVGFGRDLDRMLDEVWRGFGFPAAHVAEPGAFTPRVDVRETENELVVAAELPGLEESDITVSLEDGVLAIEGERKDERSEDGAEGYHRMETFRGRFRRAFALPFEVAEDEVKAVYKQGVLTVTLPKAAEAKPDVRTIPVSDA